MSPSFETLELEIEEQVATVRLNRPDKANSMNAAMWEDLQTCFEWLDQEPSVRAVILAGNGNHFCAGWIWRCSVIFTARPLSRRAGRSICAAPFCGCRVT